MSDDLDLGALPFVTDSARQINAARLDHFESLGLTRPGESIADFGGGPGLLAERLSQCGLRVTLFEPRQELAAMARRRLPLARVVQCNLLHDDLVAHGRFAHGFAYGLLYHLSDPLLGLTNIARVVDRILFVETQVTDSADALVRFVDEPDVANQAVDGWGTRPSLPWLVRALQHVGFPYVYQSPTPPAFADFLWEPRHDNTAWRDGHPLRAVVIASRDRLAPPLRLLAPPKGESSRPALSIGSGQSTLDFAAAVTGFDEPPRGLTVFAPSLEIEHVLDAAGELNDDLLTRSELHHIERLIVRLPDVDLERVLPSFPQARSVHVRVERWSDALASGLSAAIEWCREAGWRVADARSLEGSVVVELTRKPLPPPVVWAPLHYDVEQSQEGSVTSGPAGMLVTTPQGPWSYGVIMKLKPNSAVQIRLRIGCTGAPCEVGTLTSVSDIFHAVTILPGEGATTVTLRAPASLYGVVIRTASLPGPARVTIFDVSGAGSAPVDSLV